MNPDLKKDNTPMQRVDLHTHSHFSDGALSPSALITAAHAAGVEVLALTDHDTLDGLPEARVTAQTLGIQLLDGIELSTQWEKPARLSRHRQPPVSIHVVGLGMTERGPMDKLLAEQQQCRADRARAMCTKLAECVQCDPWPAVCAMVDGRADRITRTHLANWLVAEGKVTRHQQAFDRWLGEGKAAHVPLPWVSLAEGIRVICESGGVSILAHPARYTLSATHRRKLITDFAELGGDALELPSENEPFGTRTMIYRLVDQLELKVSVGSDFHGEHMPWHRLGQTPAVIAGMQPVWEGLVTG